MEAAGIEPSCRNSEVADPQGLTENENVVAAVGQRQDCVLCQQLARVDAGLKNDIESIARAWATLDPNVRAAILTLIGTQPKLQ